jgi:hypothetical protein
MTTKKEAPVQQALNTCSPSELTELLIGLYAQGNPKPIVLGQPGCGKTAICYQVAEKLNIPKYTFQATLYDPTEIKGLPVFDHENNTARFLPFEDMPSIGEGILVVDDLPHAPTQTQNAFMRLILEGKAGAWDLGKLFPIATGNRALDRAGAKDLQTAMANRFCFLNLEVSYEDWHVWAINKGIHPSVVAYISTPNGKEWLNKFNPDYQINATPRSWEAVSNVMYAMKGNSSLAKIAMMGCIGEEATIKYSSWVKYYEKMPDLGKIVGGKNIYPEELDVMYATVSGLVSMVKTFPKKETIMQRLIDYSVAMPDKFIELGALLSKDLLILSGKQDFLKINLTKWVEKYPDLIVGGD